MDLRNFDSRGCDGRCTSGVRRINLVLSPAKVSTPHVCSGPKARCGLPGREPVRIVAVFAVGCALSRMVNECVVFEGSTMNNKRTSRLVLQEDMVRLVHAARNSGVNVHGFALQAALDRVKRVPRQTRMMTRK
jgi:hypothetical protein